ncbi:MAG: hypothetical protein PHR35_12650, partial [Kiritimatiellae bacterium]|nr:hypothetical protein [Kiritimatiellia bacterium]
MKSTIAMKPTKFAPLALLALLALGSPPAGAAVELLNGGFAAGDGINPDVWIENSLDLSCRHTWGSQDGDGYLMGLNGWAGAYGTQAEFHQDVTNVVAGNAYGLVFHEEGESGWNGSNVTGRLLWLDANTEVIGGVTTNLDAYTHQGGWVRRGLCGIAPQGVVGARVQFDAQILPTGGVGAAKFDNFTLTEYPGLLSNPGFAHGQGLDADFWTEMPSTTKAGRESWGSSDGDGFLMALQGYNSGTYGTFYQDLAGVKPNFRYKLTFSVAGQADYNGSNVTARLIWLDDSMTPVASVTTNLDAYTATVDWSPVSLESISPVGAT